MSSVLIGIIGVILFIGLALAGALFLGPRFQESSNTSKAAAATQAVQLVANAISLRNADSGQQMLATNDATMRRRIPAHLLARMDSRTVPD